MMPQQPVCHCHQDARDDRAKPLDHAIVVMFTDLAEYTRIAAVTTPLETGDLMARLLEGQIAAVEAAGGTIWNLTGDGIMACWLVRTSALRGAHCASALRAAFEIVADVRGLNSPANPEQPLVVRVGLHIGTAATEVSVRCGGGMHRTLIGDTVNIAARLQQERRAGDPATRLGPIRVSEDFQRELPPRAQALLPRTSIAQVCTRTVRVFSSSADPARGEQAAA
jgi:class 3 adenylate cyclase